MVSRGMMVSTVLVSRWDAESMAGAGARDSAGGVAGRRSRPHADSPTTGSISSASIQRLYLGIARKEARSMVKRQRRGVER
jgi:hypothetical protein